MLKRVNASLLKEILLGVMEKVGVILSQKEQFLW
jgi:hypothetical protein